MFDVITKSIRSESTMSLRPKLCQIVVRNLDYVDRCDGVRVDSY